MRVEILKDNEPYFKGDVVEILNDVDAKSLEERGIAKVVSGDTPLYQANVARTQDGVSVYDKRRRGLEDGPVPEDGAVSGVAAPHLVAPVKENNVHVESESTPASSDEIPSGSKYDDMNGEALKEELASRGLPVSGKVDELRARLRENDAASA